MFNRSLRLLGTYLVVVLVFPLAALAQKPSPSPLPPPPPPPGVDVPAWKAAYESANRPSILVVVGWSTEVRNAPEGAINAEPLTFTNDPGGFAESFRLAICEHLSPPEADIELVNAAATAAARQRLTNNLDIRREGEAIALLATASDADIVVLVRLYGDMQRGLPVRANMTAANSRGRELLSYTSGWNTGNDASSTLKMGSIFAAEISRKLSGRFTNPQRYTTHIFGLADAEAAFAMAQCLQEGRGVSKVKSNRGGGGGRDVFREYEITTSLEQDMLEVFIGRCVAPMNLIAEMVSLEGGVVNIRVLPKPKETAPTEPSIADCIVSLADKQHKDGDRYRKELMELYGRRQQPTFAVLINRRLSEPERQQLAAAGQPVTAENLIVVQSAGSASSVIGGGSAQPPTKPDAGGIDSQFDRIKDENNANITLEGLIYTMLGTELLNFNRRVDGPTARAKLAELIDAQKKVFREDELASLLSRANIAQYVIIGYGSEGTYNFRLVNQDGQLLSSPSGIVSKSAKKGTKLTVDDLKSIANQAVAQLACELRHEWSRPNQASVTLKGIADAQDAINIEKVLKSEAKLFQLVGNFDFTGIGPSQGVCKFAITHKADLTNTQILEEIRRIAGPTGLDLSLESGDYSNYVFVVKRK